MAQHDYDIANQAGAAFRSDLNSALSAIVSNNSGATAPSTTFAYQWWADTTTGLLKVRNAANSAWVTVGTLASANLGLLSSAEIGSTVQAYDVDTAKLDVAQTFSAVQKSTVTTDNDLTIDCATAMDVVCTPTAGGALTLNNKAAGQKFEILFINNSNYAITVGANIKVQSTLLATISVTGRYILAARCLDGTNIDLTCSGALA
jgi:hypothetical protein